MSRVICYYFYYDILIYKIKVYCFCRMFLVIFKRMVFFNLKKIKLIVSIKKVSYFYLKKILYMT